MLSHHPQSSLESHVPGRTNSTLRSVGEGLIVLVAIVRGSYVRGLPIWEQCLVQFGCVRPDVMHVVNAGTHGSMVSLPFIPGKGIRVLIYLYHFISSSIEAVLCGSGS